MKAVVFIICIFCTVRSFSKDEFIEEYCSEFGGEIVTKYKCPKSKLTIPFTFCVIDREDKLPLFFDGCTGPAGGFSSLFYPSCIKHDFCYHKEPSTNGKTQKDCDQEFKKNLLDDCKKTEDQKKCNRWAKTLFMAVRGFGKLAYNCADIKE